MRNTITIFLSRKSLASLSRRRNKTEKKTKQKKETKSETSVRDISFVSGTVPEDPGRVAALD